MSRGDGDLDEPGERTRRGRGWGHRRPDQADPEPQAGVPDDPSVDDPAADAPQGAPLTARLRRGADDETLRDQLREASAAALRRVEERTPPRVATRIRAFRERIRSRRSLDTAWRVMVFTLGMTLLIAGLVMFVVPGPGWATIILALVVLGSEFTWATRALDPVKGAARRATQAALDPRRRRRNLALGAVAGVVAGLVVLWYLEQYGLTVDPIMSLLASALDWARDLVS